MRTVYQFWNAYLIFLNYYFNPYFEFISHNCGLTWGFFDVNVCPYTNKLDRYFWTDRHSSYNITVYQNLIKKLRLYFFAFEKWIKLHCSHLVGLKLMLSDILKTHNYTVIRHNSNPRAEGGTVRGSRRVEVGGLNYTTLNL